MDTGEEAVPFPMRAELPRQASAAASRAGVDKRRLCAVVRKFGPRTLWSLLSGAVSNGIH